MRAPPEWVAVPMPSPPVTRALRCAAALVLACLLVLSPAAGAAPSIAGKRSEIAELGRQVAELDVQAGAAAAAHNRAIDRLEVARRTLLITRGELRIARRDLRRSRAVLAQRLVDLYVAGRPTFIQVLLTSGSVGEAYE